MGDDAGESGEADASRGLSRRNLLLGLAAGGAAGTLLGSSVGQLGAAVTATSDAVTRVAAPPKLNGTGVLREYWLQVESFEHDVAPTGRNDMMGTHVLGSQFWGLGYRA